VLVRGSELLLKQFLLASQSFLFKLECLLLMYSLLEELGGRLLLLQEGGAMWCWWYAKGGFSQCCRHLRVFGR
jgi:hypothetical protein